MKKYISILCLSLFFVIGYAQTNKTKIEEAVFTKGSLYKQEVFSVDNITAFRLDAIKVTNLEKFDITTGVRVVQKRIFGKNPETFTNYIDANEISGVITALQYIKTILKSNTVPSNYTEIKYSTPLGFQIALITILNEQDKLTWEFMAQPNSSIEKTRVSLSLKDIDTLLKAFEQAKQKLQ